MDMILDAVDLIQLTAFIRDQGGDILVEFVAVMLVEGLVTVFRAEDDLVVDLSVSANRRKVFEIRVDIVQPLRGCEGVWCCDVPPVAPVVIDSQPLRGCELPMCHRFPDGY